MQPPAALLQAGNWALLATIVGGLAFVLVVTARRPADDRDAFIRTLPPPSQPLAVRAAHLRRQRSREMTKVVKIYAIIEGVFLAIGVLAALSLNKPIAEGITAMAIPFGLPCVFAGVFSSLYVLARYRGAHLRLLNDVVWHARPDEPPATVPTDI